MREIREIVIHATMTGNDADLTIKDLDRKHRQAGWNGVGYHFVIRRSGEVQIGRHVDNAGAHVKGFDRYSIGICLVGGLPEGNFTDAQWAALSTLCRTLHAAYPSAKIIGHRDCPHMTTTCPTFDVVAWWQQQDASRFDVV